MPAAGPLDHLHLQAEAVCGCRVGGVQRYRVQARLGVDILRICQARTAHTIPEIP